MEQRPKLKIKLTIFDKILEATCYFLLFALWIFAIFGYFKLPDNIPIHYDGSGQVTNYGSKIMFFMLPLIATVIFFALSILINRPHVLNYTKPITEENCKRQYTIATSMLRFMKFSILLIFSLILLFTYFTAVGITKGLGRWFLPFVLSLTIIAPIYFLIKSINKK